MTYHVAVAAKAEDESALLQKGVLQYIFHTLLKVTLPVASRQRNFPKKKRFLRNGEKERYL